MSNDRIRRDKNKIMLSTHHAFNKTFATLDPIDISIYKIYTNKNMYLEEIIRLYEKTYKLYKEQNPNKLITIFDKTLCLSMVLKKFNTFGYSSQNTVPTRIKLINERYIVEVMLALLHFSEYNIRAAKKGELFPLLSFDLDTLMAEYKELLERYIYELTSLLGQENFEATKILEKLKELYDTAILYGNGIKEEDFPLIRKRIRVKETINTTKLKSKEPYTLKIHRETLKQSVIN